MASQGFLSFERFPLALLLAPYHIASTCVRLAPFWPYAASSIPGIVPSKSEMQQRHVALAGIALKDVLSRFARLGSGACVSMAGGRDKAEPRAALISETLGPLLTL